MIFSGFLELVVLGLDSKDRACIVIRDLIAVRLASPDKSPRIDLIDSSSIGVLIFSDNKLIASLLCELYSPSRMLTMSFASIWDLMYGARIRSCA